MIKLLNKDFQMLPHQLVLWRLKVDATQVEAAELLGCGRRSIQDWEAGRSAIPRYLALACRAVAEGLRPWGTNPTELQFPETEKDESVKP